MGKIITVSELQTQLKEAFIRLVDKVGQSDLVANGINQTIASNIYHGRKGIGDETIAKLDRLYPDWRTIPNNTSTSQPESKFKIEFLGLKEFKRQLNFFYDGMCMGNKEALVMIANRLYEIDNPNDTSATGRRRNDRNNQEELKNDS